MPVVQIHMYSGRSTEKKQELINEVRKTVAKVLDRPMERVWVMLEEKPKENWGV